MKKVLLITAVAIQIICMATFILDETSSAAGYNLRTIAIILAVIYCYAVLAWSNITSYRRSGTLGMF